LESFFRCKLTCCWMVAAGLFIFSSVCDPRESILLGLPTLLMLAFDRLCTFYEGMNSQDVWDQPSLIPRWGQILRPRSVKFRLFLVFRANGSIVDLSTPPSFFFVFSLIPRTGPNLRANPPNVKLVFYPQGTILCAFDSRAERFLPPRSFLPVVQSSDLIHIPPFFFMIRTRPILRVTHFRINLQLSPESLRNNRRLPPQTFPFPASLSPTFFHCWGSLPSSVGSPVKLQRRNHQRAPVTQGDARVIFYPKRANVDYSSYCEREAFASPSCIAAFRTAAAAEQQKTTCHSVHLFHLGTFLLCSPPPRRL